MDEAKNSVNCGTKCHKREKAWCTLLAKVMI
jgi:hypothetical protein